MGFLERFQKIKGVQEVAEAASNVLNQTTTGRVGGNLGKIEPELQAPIVNPGSVADGDKNPANLVKQQLATTEKPAIAAAAKIEKEKKKRQGAEGAGAPAVEGVTYNLKGGATAPEVQTVTKGGTKAEGGTQTDFASKFPITGKKSNFHGDFEGYIFNVSDNRYEPSSTNNNENRGNIAQMLTYGNTEMPMVNTSQMSEQSSSFGRDTDEKINKLLKQKTQQNLNDVKEGKHKPIEEPKPVNIKGGGNAVSDLLDEIERENEELRERERKAERRKENLKAIYGILNGAGAALAGRKGLQTGAKEEGEKVIKNMDDKFTRRMEKARADLKEKQARAMKEYDLQKSLVREAKDDAYKQKELEIKQQEADTHKMNANTNAQKVDQAAKTLEEMGIDWTQLDFTKKNGGLDLNNVPAYYVDKIAKSISALAGAKYGFTNANANMVRANAAATRAANASNGTITTRTEQVFVPDYNSFGERVGGHFETREIKTEKSPANGSGGAWKPNGNNSKGAWKPNK